MQGQTHLNDLSVAELDPIPHIKGMHHEQEEYRLVQALDAVAEDEDEGQGDSRDGHPQVGNIHLDTTSIRCEGTRVDGGVEMDTPTVHGGVEMDTHKQHDEWTQSECQSVTRDIDSVSAPSHKSHLLCLPRHQYC